jgi:hypothetical protein
MKRILRLLARAGLPVALGLAAVGAAGGSGGSPAGNAADLELVLRVRVWDRELLRCELVTLGGEAPRAAQRPDGPVWTGAPRAAKEAGRPLTPASPIQRARTLLRLLVRVLRDLWMLASRGLLLPFAVLS